MFPLDNFFPIFSARNEKLAYGQKLFFYWKYCSPSPGMNGILVKFCSEFSNSRGVVLFTLWYGFDLWDKEQYNTNIFIVIT